MSNRDDYNFDNFDVDNSLDSREYRRRHPQRRNSSYNGRPAYDLNRSRNTSSGRSATRRPTSREIQRRRVQRKRRLRNRITIVSVIIVVFLLLALLINMMFRGCSGKNSKTKETISTETKSTGDTRMTTPTIAANEAINDLSPTYFATPKIEDDNTNGTSAYSIYVWHNIGYELFGSDSTKAKKYADTISRFANQFGSGVKVYDMVVPNHTEMGLPQRLKDGEAPSGSQAENIKAIYAGLSDRVTPINCYNFLANHNTEYTYYNSDHHWTGLGAYYAYSAFAESTKQAVLKLENCTEKQIEGFEGSFSNSASGLTPDTVHYWEFPYSVSMDISYSDGTVGEFDSPYYQYATSGSNTYGVFIMGDNQDTGLTVLKSSSEKAGQGKKIAVVKESYGNAFVPYLTYNYSEVHVVDFRYFSNNLVSYCSENGIDEVLFINGVMSANTQIQLDSMSNMFN